MRNMFVSAVESSTAVGTLDTEILRLEHAATSIWSYPAPVLILVLVLNSQSARIRIILLQHAELVILLPLSMSIEYDHQAALRTL
jgi:hypothetical protein